MKTLKSMLAGIIVLFTCAAANATVRPVIAGPSQSDVVNIYISAITNGNATGLDKVLDNDLQFNVHQGEKVSTLNKGELMDYLKSNSVVSTSVNANTTILQQDDNSAKVKIDFKYDGYTRTDVVTLNKTTGWQIVNVDSSTH